MMKRLWTGAMVSCCAVAVMAAEGGEKIDNEVIQQEMVVIAARDARDAATMPGNVTVLTGQALRDGAYVSVSDALRDLAGVHVRSITGNPVSAEIGMRGFGENSHGRVLVLVDGRRLNRPDMAAINWLQLSPDQVERIEVLRGGASALYGDNAVGGVINVVTREGGERQVTEAGAEAGSFGFLGLRAASRGQVDGLSYAVAADRLESDGYRDRTGYRSQGANTRLKYAMSAENALFLALAWRDVAFELPGGLTLEQIRQDRKQSDTMEDASSMDYATIHAGYRAGQTTSLRFDADVFWDRKDIESDMGSWMSYHDNTIDTLGAMVSGVVDFPLGGLDSSLTLGVDFSEDSMSVSRYADIGRAMRTLSADIVKQSLAGYVRHEIAPLDTVLLSWGGRYETSRFKGETESGGVNLYKNSDRHQATAVDAAVVKTLAERSKVYAKAGTVYRYPFVDEQISYLGYGTDVFYTDIDPEQGWNVEVGGRWRTHEGWVDLAVFHNRMQDEIAWNAATFRNENLEETQRQGLEAAFRFAPRASRLRFSGNYTFTVAEFADGDNDGNDIPLVSPHKATLTAGVALPLGFEASVVSTYVDAMRLGGDNANTQDTLSDYIVVDAVLRYASSAIDGFEAYVAVDNVLNKKYASLGYAGFAADAYYPSPETGVRGGLSYRF